VNTLKALVTGTRIQTVNGLATVTVVLDHAVRVVYDDKRWQRRALHKADLIFPSQLADGSVKVVR
jgi:hypothetical protein